MNFGPKGKSKNLKVISPLTRAFWAMGKYL